MTHFAVRPVRFGPRPGTDQDGEAEGLPTPTRIKLLARRAAGIKEAQDVLSQLPGRDEELHAVTTARMDLTDFIGILFDHYGPCERCLIATLGFGRRNLIKMLAWLDAGTVGSLGLVASLFFQAHEKELWAETRRELHARQMRACCCGCHAKIVVMKFTSGEKLTICGSANLRSSGSQIEAFALINHADLADWYAGFIEGLLDKHEGPRDG